MSYKRSKSRQVATQRVKALRAPFSYAKVRTRGLPTVVRDAIFQNCVFQLSATLEDYLAELAGQWFTRLTMGGALTTSVPIYTRAFFVARSQEEAFKRFLALGDESDLVERTTQQMPAFELLDETKVMPSLDYSAKVVKDRKFPSVYNVEGMFRRLGVPKVYQLLSKRTRTNVELSWRAFMDVRNALAHENPPSITDLDVERYFRQIEIWIDAIDREFYGHVVRSSGSRYWA